MKENMRTTSFNSLEERLRDAIKSIEVKKLANATGLSRSQIYRIGSGQSKTTTEVAITIAKTTGYNIQWIAFGEGPKKSIESTWETATGFAVVKNLTEDSEYQFPISLSIEYLKHTLKVDAENCRAFTLKQDLLPPFKKNTSILIDISKKTPESDGIYLLEIGGGYQIIEVESLINGDFNVKRGKNYEVREEAVSFDTKVKLPVAGKVIWAGSQIE